MIHDCDRHRTEIQIYNLLPQARRSVFRCVEAKSKAPALQSVKPNNQNFILYFALSLFVLLLVD